MTIVLSDKNKVFLWVKSQCESKIFKKFSKFSKSFQNFQNVFKIFEIFSKFQDAYIRQKNKDSHLLEQIDVSKPAVLTKSKLRDRL
jgi:hypothetical protein